MQLNVFLKLQIYSLEVFKSRFILYESMWHCYMYGIAKIFIILFIKKYIIVVS